MNTPNAFAMGQATRGEPMLVFDWHKAARLIKETGAISASAGLSNDWEWTGGPIWADGAPVLARTAYLSSTWATPEIKLDHGEPRDCVKLQSEPPEPDEWGADTHWPDSALAMLGLEPFKKESDDA